MNRTLLNVLGIVVFALHASASLAEHRHDLNSLLKGKSLHVPSDLHL